jgi:tetratricopeptide (TPR) repeat protein
MAARGFTLSILVLLSIPAFAQTPLPSQGRNRTDDLAIRGKLIIASRDADQRIEVRLEKSTMQVLQTAYTDSAGNFEFRGLGSGAYYISVNLEGYEPVRQQVEVFNNFGGANLTIFLNKAAPDKRSQASGLDAEDRDVIDISQMKENLPKKAVQDYEKALDEKKKGKLEIAIKLLEDAIHLAPNFYHAHNNLGLLYQAIKRYPDAEKEYKRSRELNAKSERPLVNLGNLYIEEADREKDNPKVTGQILDQALDALEAAVKINPRSASAYYLLGSANYKSSFLEEAEVAYKKAYDLDQNLTRVHLLLANIYAREAKWDAVIDNIDAYLKENPKAADRAAVEDMRAKILKDRDPQRSIKN